MGEREGGRLGFDTGWTEVIRKKKTPSHGGSGRVDVATSAWNICYKDTVSFYFSKFPETHGAKEMLKAFKFYGEALEVVIPPKRDKWGRRFGFVRFNNVGDPRVFAIKLDNIIIGATKIYVNVPRFQRERNLGHNMIPHRTQQPPDHDQEKKNFAKVHRNYHEAAEKQPIQIPRKHVEASKKNHVQVPINHQEGSTRHVVQFQSHRPEASVIQSKQHQHRSFQSMKENQNHSFPRRMQVWRKKESAREVDKNKVQNFAHDRKENTIEICYTVPEEDMLKFRKMFIGTVRMPGNTYSVHEWFSMQGFFLLKVTPLGANKVLLEEMDDGVMEELQNHYSDWLNAKFEDIRGWDPDVVDVERVVWVRCHGIPVHAWQDDFFEALGRNFGELLGVDDDTRKKTSMDVARIHLRTSSLEVFNAVVTANINGSLYHIKIVEEWCGPPQWIHSSPNHVVNEEWDDDDADSSSKEDESPPLFTTEGAWCNISVEG